MSDETSNLVLQPFGGDDSDVADDPGVGVVVERQSSIVFLDDPPGGFLDGFSSYATHDLNETFLKKFY